MPKHCRPISMDATAVGATARAQRTMPAGGGRIRTPQRSGYLESQNLEVAVCEEACQRHNSALRHQSDAISIAGVGYSEGKL